MGKFKSIITILNFPAEFSCWQDKNARVTLFLYNTLFTITFSCRFSFKVLPKEEEKAAPEPVSESPVESSTPGSYYFRFYK